MNKRVQGGPPDPYKAGHSNIPEDSRPGFLGPGDDGATQSFPHFQGSERSYTSDEAQSLYRSKLPPRAQRRQQSDEQYTQPTVAHAQPADVPGDDLPLEATQAMQPISAPQHTYPAQSMPTQVPPAMPENAAAMYPPTGHGGNSAHDGYDEDGEPQSNTKLIVSIIIVLLLIAALVTVVLWKSMAQGNGDEENVQETEQTTEITQTTPEDETPSDSGDVTSEPPVQPSETKKPEPAPTKTVTQTVPAQPDPVETKTTPAQPDPNVPDTPQDPGNNADKPPATPAN